MASEQRRYELISGCGTWHFGGDSGTYSGFDRFGRIVDQKWLDASSNVKDRYKYAYDYNSNRTYRDNDLSGGKDELYTYDNLNRLTGYDRGDRSGSTINNKNRAEDWTLSAVGNWSPYKIDDDGDGYDDDDGDLTQTRTHSDANEITGISETHGDSWADPVYSARGNATTIPRPNDLANTYTCTYDAWNRLVKVEDGSGVVAEYRYDGVNRRIRKFTEPDGDDWTVREFYYNTAWQLLETRKQTKTRTDDPLTEPALATTLHKQYVWSGRYIDAPVLLWRDAIGNGTLNETLYYTTDANMNVTAMVNTSGQAIERYMYDPYGKVTVLNGASGVDKDGEVTEWTDDTVQASDVANSILFCGYYRDTETGLYHVRMRMYHPTLGRWLQRDPIGYADGMNLYEYVKSRPILLRDPRGTKSEVGDYLWEQEQLKWIEERYRKDKLKCLADWNRNNKIPGGISGQDAENLRRGSGGPTGRDEYNRCMDKARADYEADRKKIPKRPWYTQCCDDKLYDARSQRCCREAGVGTERICAKSECCIGATCGVWRHNWELMEAKSAVDCANRIMKGIDWEDEFVLGFGGLIKRIWTIAYFVGVPMQWVMAYDWCSEEECVPKP